MLVAVGVRTSETYLSASVGSVQEIYTLGRAIIELCVAHEILHQHPLDRSRKGFPTVLEIPIFTALGRPWVVVNIRVDFSETSFAHDVFDPGGVIR